MKPSTSLISVNTFDLGKMWKVLDSLQTTRSGLWASGIWRRSYGARFSFSALDTSNMVRAEPLAYWLIDMHHDIFQLCPPRFGESATPHSFQSRATPRSSREWRVTRARSFIRRSGMLAWFAKTRKSWSSAVARPQPHSSRPLPTPWPPSPCFKGHPATGRASR